jgi:hypothetical protein
LGQPGTATTTTIPKVAVTAADVFPFVPASAALSFVVDVHVFLEQRRQYPVRFVVTATTTTQLPQNLSIPFGEHILYGTFQSRPRRYDLSCQVPQDRPQNVIGTWLVVLRRQRFLKLTHRTQMTIHHDPMRRLPDQTGLATTRRTVDQHHMWDLASSSTSFLWLLFLLFLLLLILDRLMDQLQLSVSTEQQ